MQCRGLKTKRERGVLLWPNLVGSLDAPTTANCGAEKKAFAAASVAIVDSDLILPIDAGLNIGVL